MGLLEGKFAVVTGAGRGIGAAVAKGFSREGARVLVVDIDGGAAEEVAKEIKAAGGDATGAALDVSDRKAVYEFAKRITDEHGALHILVNNAGIAPRVSVDDETLTESWDKVISVNLNGQFDMTYAFIPALKKEGGSIIYTASIAAFIAPRSSPGYGAAKAGIVSLTKYMARELGTHGIRVNALAPGVIKTAMTEGSRDTEKGKSHLARVPLGRNGEADEVAGPAIFLASDMASYVTGVTIPVDGGFLVV